MNRRQRRLSPGVVHKAPQPEVSRSATTASQAWWQNDWAVLAAMVVGFAVYRIVMLAGDPGPPGSDAGNWLAYTRDLFGSSTKAAESMYFPGTLVVLEVLLAFLPDLTALKVLAIGSSLAPALPFFFMARIACSRTTSAVLTALLLMTGFYIEMMVWGGYPQLLGSAYALAALYFVDRFLLEGRRKDAAIAAGLTGLIALTHHFMLLTVLAVLLFYLPVVAFKLRQQWLSFAKRAVSLAAMAGVACLISLPWYLKYLSILAGSGSLNATAGQVTSRGDVLSYVFSEAPLTWIALVTVIPLAAMLPFGDERTRRLRPMAGALVAGPLAIYLATNELRAFQPAQAGALLCLGIIGGFAQSFLARVETKPAVALAGRVTLGLAALSLLLIIVPNSHSRFVVVRDRNAAMGTSAVQAMTWLRDNTTPGTVILPGNRDNRVIYAWWVEGFARRPAYGLVDPRFLAFKQEHEQAEIARRIVDESTPADEARRLIDEAGIRYFFVYKPSGGEFQRLADNLAVTVSYQNDEFVILKLPVQSAAARE